MSTATSDATTPDDGEGSTNMFMANGLAAIMLAIALSSSAPDVHLPESRIDCLTRADVVAHEARSHHGISLSCTDEAIASLVRQARRG